MGHEVRGRVVIRRRWSAGDLEYFSWFGYSPDGRCPRCGAIWTDVMFAYDGPHCP